MMRLSIALLSFIALGGCSKGDPQTSYCESLCDWATSCSTDERGAWPDYDESAVDGRCMTAAEAAEAGCSKAADGLDAASGKLLTKCTDAIDAAAAAGECGGFSGSIDEIKLGTTPTACVSQGADAQSTYVAARDGAAETNDELCERFAYTFCDTVQTCVLGSLGVDDVGSIPEELVNAAGGTPFDLCLVELESETSACVADGNYTLEQDLTDVNLMRQGARECLRDFSTASCSDLGNGDLSPTCGVAVSDPSVLTSAMTHVVAAYVTD